MSTKGLKIDAPPRHVCPGEPVSIYRRPFSFDRIRERMQTAVEHARTHKPYPLRIWEKDQSK